MADIIEEFVIKMRLEGKEWAQDAKEAAKSVDDVKESVKEAGEEMKKTESAGNSFGNMTEGLKSKVMGLASAFTALYGIQQTFTSYLSEADQIGKFSNMIGANIEDVHAWGKAVELSGGTMEGFQGSLKNLQTQLAKIATTGNSRILPVLQSMGIDPGGQGRMRNAFEVMEEIAGAMEKMGKAESLGKGSLLQFDTGTIMALQQGRDVIGDMVMRLKELGVYTKEDAEITAQFNDAILISKMGFMGLAGIVFRWVTPAFTGIVDGFTQFVGYLKQHEVAVKAFFTGLATVITAKLIPAFASLFKNLAKNPYTWVVIGLAAIAIAIEDLYTWAHDGDAAFGEFWESIFGSKKDALQFFEDMKGLANDLLYIVKELVAAWKEFHKLSTGDSAIGNIKEIKKKWDNFSVDQYFTDAQNRYNSGSGIFESFMGSEEEVQRFNDKLDKYFNFDSIKEKAGAQGAESGEAFSQGFGDSMDNFLIDWNDNGFFEAWEHDSEETKEAVTRHFAEQGKAISATGQDIDTLNAKLDALRQNILTMPVYNPSMAFAGGATYNSANTRIGAINVNTQATDASGIGASIAPVVRSGFNPYKSNGGAW